VNCAVVGPICNFSLVSKKGRWKFSGVKEVKKNKSKFLSADEQPFCAVINPS